MIENVKTTVRNMGVDIFTVCVTSVTLKFDQIVKGYRFTKRDGKQVNADNPK